MWHFGIVPLQFLALIFSTLGPHLKYLTSTAVKAFLILKRVKVNLKIVIVDFRAANKVKSQNGQSKLLYLLVNFHLGFVHDKNDFF